MSDHYESAQAVEVITDAAGFEPEFLITIDCTNRSRPGRWSDLDGGDPPQAAEFELVNISLLVPRVNRRDGQSDYAPSLTISWEQFCAIVGKEIAEDLYERAVVDAIENGDF